MHVTLHPTDEYAMHVGISVRVWAGKRDDGSEVRALVAAMSAPGGVIGNTPMPPPPSPDWSHRMRYAMTRLWQLGDRLTDSEASELAALAEGWVIERNREARHAGGA